MAQLNTKLSKTDRKDLICIANNVDHFLKDIGKHNRRPATSYLTKNVSVPGRAKFFSQQNQVYVNNSHNPSVVKQMMSHDLFTGNYSVNTSRSVFREHEITALLDWCKTVEFGARSGDHIETYYRIDSKDCVYYEHYRGSGSNGGGFVTIVGLIAEMCLHIVSHTDLHKPKTRFHHNLSVYKKFGANSRILKIGEERDSVVGSTSLWPMSYNSFWNTIKCKKGEGFRLTYLRHPHPCEMCSRLNRKEKKLNSIQIALDSEQDSTKKIQLAKQVKRLQILVDRRRDHLKSLKHQRNWINKNIRDKLVVGQVLVQADYVSFYNIDGNSIHDLVLVLHYVDHDDGPIIRHYIDNFFQGHHVSSSTIAILDYLFTSTSTFDKFDTVFFSGDTGSGFRQCETLYFYSTLFRDHNKKVAVHFLAPRHAFNMADSHGGRLSELFADAKSSSEALRTVESYCIVVRRSNLKNVSSFYHINPNNNTIVNPSLCRKVHGIMKLLSFEFSHVSEDNTIKRTPGVMRASQLSGERMILFDVRPRKKGARCHKCEEYYVRPVLAHDSCPIENNSFIDTSVRSGESAGVRNSPPPPPPPEAEIAQEESSS